MMLGGAKRVSLARMLKQAGERRGMDVVIFSYELSREVPIAEVATVIVGRRWRDPDLMNHLHEVIKENNIDIILPFVDPAVEVAARFCNAENGCWTPMTDPAKARMLFDKIEADAVFRSMGFPLPALADGADKVIAKPRCGSASQGIKVFDRARYEAFRATGEAAEYLCQEFIERHEEVSVDCYVSTVGEFVCAVPRRRLAVSGGEVTDTVTIDDARICSLSEKILRELDLRGPSTLQFICRKSADGVVGEPLLMEINPRLGGGVVCSVHAGADIPAFILADWQGEAVGRCDTWRPGVRISRYMQEVVFTS